MADPLDADRLGHDLINVDLELQLAQKLMSSGPSDRPLLPDSFVARLSAEELEEFQQAQECLAFLNNAAASAMVDTKNQSTIRGDTTNENSTEVNLHSNEVLGRFEIVRELGRGGFGVVFLAIDPRLQRNVALKIPRGNQFLDPEASQRFKREAKAAAILSHPAIVPIFETGTIGPVTYIAYEYCEGHSLAHWLKKNIKTPPRVAAEMIGQLADAVQHAHSRGIIHRDLKPANVLIASEPSVRIGNQDRPPQMAAKLRITDFGLARIQTESSELTREGATVGTPAYMAPEQANGKSESTPSSDIYGLGVILFELLTGRVPFQGQSNLETVNLVVEQPPPSPRKFVSRIPRDLSAICLKCLEKNPDRRYSSCQKLSDDLQRFIAGRSVIARETSALETFARWVRRKPMVATLLLALVMFTILSTGLWIRSERLRHESATNLAVANARATNLENAVDSMLEKLGDLPEIHLQGMDPLRREMLKQADHYYGLLADSDPENASLRLKQNQTKLNLAWLKFKLADRPGALKIVEHLFREGPAGSASELPAFRFQVDVMLMLAKLKMDTGDVQAYQTMIDRAMMVSRTRQSSLLQPNQDEQIELARTLSEVASLCSKYGHFKTGNELILEAVEIWTALDIKTIQDNKALLSAADTYLVAGQNHAMAEKGVEAKPFLESAISIYESLDHGIASLDSQARNNLGKAYYFYGFCHLNDRQQALAIFENAIVIFEQLSQEHPLVPDYAFRLRKIQYLQSLTQYLAGLNETDNLASLQLATELLKTNIEMCQVLVMQFPDSRKVFTNPMSDSISLLGIIYGLQKEHGKQLPLLQRAYELKLDTFQRSGQRATDEILVLGASGDIAACQIVLQRYDEAIIRLNESNARLKQIVEADPDSRQAKRFLMNGYKSLAEAYFRSQNYAQAISNIRLAEDNAMHETAESLMGKESLYLIHDQQFANATTSFLRYSEYQLAGNAQQQIELINTACHALGDLAELETDENTSGSLDELTACLIENAMDAIVNLQADEEFTAEAMSKLLDEATLHPLRKTEAFLNWHKKISRCGAMNSMQATGKLELAALN